MIITHDEFETYYNITTMRELIYINGFGVLDLSDWVEFLPIGKIRDLGISCIQKAFDRVYYSKADDSNLNVFINGLYDNLLNKYMNGDY